MFSFYPLNFLSSLCSLKSSAVFPRQLVMIYEKTWKSTKTRNESLEGLQARVFHWCRGNLFESTSRDIQPNEIAPGNFTSTFSGFNGCWAAHQNNLFRVKLNLISLKSCYKNSFREPESKSWLWLLKPLLLKGSSQNSFMFQAFLGLKMMSQLVTCSFHWWVTLNFRSYWMNSAHKCWLEDINDNNDEMILQVR